MRRLALFVVVPGVVVGAFIWWGWLRAPVVGDLEDVADRFTPRPEWELVLDDANGRAPFCGDVPCPSVVRQWLVPEQLALAELEALFAAAGWELAEADDDCRPAEQGEQGAGSFVFCRAAGSADGLNVSLQVTGPESAQPQLPYRLTVTVEP